MLPKGWRRGVIAELIADLCSGVSVNGEDRSPVDGDACVLKISAVSRGVFDPAACKPIKLSDLPRARTSAKADRIIISRSNTSELVGASAYVDRPYPLLFLPDLLWQAEPKEGEDFDMRWLAFWFGSPAIRRKLSALGSGSSGSMKKLTKRNILSLGIDIPPPIEQQRIAGLLATWGEAIAMTERLLANSRKQKQVLIEDLICERRHKGSPKGRVTSLGEVASVTVSSVNKKNEDGERPVRLCNYTDVYYNERITSGLNFLEATASEGEIAKYSIRCGDVLITKDSEDPADIAISAYIGEDIPGLVCGYHLAIIRPDTNQVDPVFLNGYFSLRRTRAYFASQANGATRFGLPIGAIQSAPIWLPDIQMQRRISQAISTIAGEIACLEKHLDVLNAQKRGLMQQLLTGKRRVRLGETTGAANA